jgi:hypothetical protein
LFHPTINAIYHAAVWGTRGNYRSIPTDARSATSAGVARRPFVRVQGRGFIFDIAAFYT